MNFESSEQAGRRIMMSRRKFIVSGVMASLDLLAGCNNNSVGGKGEVKTRNGDGNIIGSATNEQKVTDNIPVADNDEEGGKKENFFRKVEEVKEDDFVKMVDFIESWGKVVKDNRRVPCDHQFIFHDSKGNRHSMIVIRRNEDNQPSIESKVRQISVWAYRDGIRDQEHYFGYAINGSAVFSLNKYVTKKDIENISFGYKEFLALVNKSK